MDSSMYEGLATQLIGLGAGIVGVAGSLTAGYLKGQSMKQGIAIEPQSLDNILTFGPLAFGSVGGALYGNSMRRNTSSTVSGLFTGSGIMMGAQIIGIGAGYLLS